MHYRILEKVAPSIGLGILSDYSLIDSMQTPIAWYSAGFPYTRQDLLVITSFPLTPACYLVPQAPGLSLQPLL